MVLCIRLDLAAVWISWIEFPQADQPGPSSPPLGSSCPWSRIKIKISLRRLINLVVIFSIAQTLDYSSLQII